MVRSLLDYCVPVWAPYKKRDIEVLEKAQKKATKIIPEIRHLPYIHTYIHTYIHLKNININVQLWALPHPEASVPASYTIVHNNKNAM